MKFNELTQKAQRKAIDYVSSDEAFIAIIDDFIYDAIDNYFNDHTCGYREEFELSYNLDHSQGRGASFTGKISGSQVDSFPFAKYVKNDDISISFIRDSYQYAHKYTVSIYVDVTTEDYTDEEYNALETAVHDWYENLCDEIVRLYDDLYNDYYSDEFIREYIEDNGFEFDKDGNLI